MAIPRWDDVIFFLEEVFEFGLRILVRSTAMFNWRVVRGLAMLRILTRASYLLLIFVPVLAGLWSGVRLVANQYNRAVEDATVLMDSAQKDFEQQVRALDTRLVSFINRKTTEASDTNDTETRVLEVTEAIQQSAQSVTNAVNRFRDDYIPKTIEKPNLPWSWAAAFFAALSAVLAHTLFQLTGPEIVKRISLSDFVAERKDDFSRHQSDDSLERAERFQHTRRGLIELDRERYKSVSMLRGLFEEEQRNERKLFIDKLSLRRIVLLKELLLSEAEDMVPEKYSPEKREELLADLKEAEDRLTKGIPPETLRNQRNMALIERGARYEYPPTLPLPENCLCS